MNIPFDITENIFLILFAIAILGILLGLLSMLTINSLKLVTNFYAWYKNLDKEPKKWLMHLIAVVIRFEKPKNFKHLKDKLGTFLENEKNETAVRFKEKAPEDYTNSINTDRDIEESLSEIKSEFNFNRYSDKEEIIKKIKGMLKWAFIWPIITLLALAGLAFLQIHMSSELTEVVEIYKQPIEGFIKVETFQKIDYLVKNGSFDAGDDYWSIQLLGSEEKKPVTKLRDTGYELFLPPGTTINFSQASISKPFLSKAKVTLHVKGRLITKTTPLKIAPKIKNSIGQTKLLPEPFFIFKSGDFEKKLDINGVENNLINIDVKFEYEGQQSREIAKLLIEEIQISTSVISNTLIVRLFENAPYYTKLKINSSWSDYFDVHKYNTQGNLDLVASKRRIGDSGTTVIENLEAGLYRVEAKFFGITYDVKDSILVTTVDGGFVEMVTEGLAGRIDIDIRDSQGEKIKNADIVIYSYTGEKVSDSRKESAINVDRWVWSPIKKYAANKEYYNIEIYKENELIYERNKVKPTFPYYGGVWKETIIL